jgi:hypothetical protein
MEMDTTAASSALASTTTATLASADVPTILAKVKKDIRAE